MGKVNRAVQWRRVCQIFLILSGIASGILWDKYELNREFVAVRRLLQTARIHAVSQEQRIIVKFGDGEIRTSDHQCLSVPCLCEIHYNTTLGSEMIVFDVQGTSRYNIREHGGDLTLRSYSGLFERHIAVNCTGFVSEGVYPED